MDAAVDRYLDEHRDRHLEELKELIRIPSVSALPEHRADMRRTAEWLAEHLRCLGAPEVAVIDTEGHPVVCAEWPAAPGQPTALIYGHYDVQPPDPLDRWETPPFEPTVRGERLYARGACDDKGNLFMALKGLEAVMAVHGRPPLGVKCFFEGEEEIFSPSLPGFVRAHRDRLLADVAICADGPQWSLDTPSLCVGSKGICKAQIDLRTANTDLHSGQAGAAVPNAIERLARLVSSFHTPDGRVAVQGFYDSVRDLTPAERAEIARVPFDERQFAAGLDLPALWGEPGYSALERIWARPTVDFNGFWGGFEGEGSKTVTPCEAHVKVTCRLVPNQEPDAILDLLEAHVRANCPPGATVTFSRQAGSSRPFGVSPERPALRRAGEVLHAIYGKPPLITRLGGTLPIAEVFQEQLGVDTVFFGFGLPDDRVHAPNESFHLTCFDRARRAHAAYLLALTDLPVESR